eukprot:1343071-Amorphochlora_amoeboformis.AAC.1
MNQDEATSNGAALQAAKLSPRLRVCVWKKDGEEEEVLDVNVSKSFFSLIQDRQTQLLDIYVYVILEGDAYITI